MAGGGSAQPQPLLRAQLTCGSPPQGAVPGALLEGSLVSMPATPVSSSSRPGVCFPAHEADTAAHRLALRGRIRSAAPL